MPRTLGVFRQQRQTYNTKSIVRLYGPKVEEKVSNESFYRANNAREFNERIRNEKRSNHSNYRRSLTLYSRRRKRRLLKSLQEPDDLIGDQLGISEDMLRPQSRCNLRRKPRKCKSKISQHTSTAVLVDSYGSGSDDIARKSHQYTSTESPSNCSIDLCVKPVQTHLSLTSERIQATESQRNVSVMAVAGRNAVEKQTQKSEQMVVKTIEEKGTDMMEYYTLSDLYCIEWIHRNLLEINLNPYHIVEDERIKEASEITCYSSKLSL